MVSLSSRREGRFFSAPMMLRVNGEEYGTEKETLSALLEELKVRPERVAVEVNLKIIRRSDFPGFRLNQGDVVEIVNFVGGGQKCSVECVGIARPRSAAGFGR